MEGARVLKGRVKLVTVPLRPTTDSEPMATNFHAGTFDPRENPAGTVSPLDAEESRPRPPSGNRSLAGYFAFSKKSTNLILYIDCYEMRILWPARSMALIT